MSLGLVHHVLPYVGNGGCFIWAMQHSQHNQCGFMDPVETNKK